MKIKPLFFAYILGLGLLAIYLLRGGMSTATEVVDEFAKASRQGQIEQAHSYLSSTFKNQTDSAQLAQFLSTSMLSKFDRLELQSETLTGDFATVVARLETAEQSSVSVEFNVVRENSGWRIARIKQLPGGDTKSAIKMPPLDQQQELARESMAVFAQSVKDGSMAAFHRHISSIWQDQADQQHLEQTYSSLIDAEVDLTGLSKILPEISPDSAINDEGVLVLNGVYPTRPSEVKFAQKFVYQENDGGWRLLGLYIQFEPKGD